MLKWRTQTTFWTRSFSSNKAWPCIKGLWDASQFFQVQILSCLALSTRVANYLKWTKIVASTHLTKNLSITKVSSTDCIPGKFFNILFFSHFTFSNIVSAKTVSIRPVKTPRLCMLIAAETQLEFLRGIRVLSIVCINPFQRKLWAVLGMVRLESGILQLAPVSTSWRAIHML